jgi:isocitrate/isopropylmalate dehydrogenase
MYPKIQFEKMIVDNTTMQMVSKPQQVRFCAANY